MTPTVEIEPLLDLSMTKLDTWSRCDRRFFYRYVRGLVPAGTDWKLQWGTLWHYCAQAYYRSLKNGYDDTTALRIAQADAELVTLVPNEHHGDTEITLDEKQRETLWDTFMFYYEQKARNDDWEEIVAVEESIYLIVRYNGKPLMRIRNTLDLLARQAKTHKLVPVDHKTTGDVEQNLLFLKLDMQARVYPLAVAAVYGEDPLFCYNMVAREVPPGYAHRSLLTDTGKKRSPDTLASMQNPARYLRREWLSYTPEQYASFQRRLVQDALTLQFENHSGIWPRREIKMGGMACDSCPYFSICGAELDGRIITDNCSLLQMAFTKDPKVV